MTLRSQAAGRRSHRGIQAIAMALVLGAGALLAGCAAAPDYDPPAEVYPDGYPAYGYFGFDYWDGWSDWHHHRWDHGEHWR